MAERLPNYMDTTERLHYAICQFWAGRYVYIRIRPARYQCTHCKGNPTTTQKLTWYEPRSPHTIAYEEHVLRELVHSTVLDVSIKEDLGYEAVMGIIRRHVQTEVD